MKKFYWFARTGIACKESKELSFDLTPYIAGFVKNKLWERVRYRSEYSSKFDEADILKIKSIKIHIHTDIAPLSNLHEYENVVNRYIPLEKISKVKLFSSGLNQVDKLAVIEVELNSSINVAVDLTYEQEKDLKAVFATLTDDVHDQISESERVKSIACEFICNRQYLIGQ